MASFNIWVKGGAAIRFRLFVRLGDLDDCVSFDLDQPLGVNETRDLHDGVGGANVNGL